MRQILILHHPSPSREVIPMFRKGLLQVEAGYSTDGKIKEEKDPNRFPYSLPRTPVRNKFSLLFHFTCFSPHTHEMSRVGHHHHFRDKVRLQKSKWWPGGHEACMRQSHSFSSGPSLKEYFDNYHCLEMSGPKPWIFPIWAGKFELIL